jgi:hypothetical protein
LKQLAAQHAHQRGSPTRPTDTRPSESRQDASHVANANDVAAGNGVDGVVNGADGVDGTPGDVRVVDDVDGDVGGARKRDGGDNGQRSANEAPGALDAEQSDPVHSGEHVQLPAWHVPAPLQP